MGTCIYVKKGLLEQKTVAVLVGFMGQSLSGVTTVDGPDLTTPTVHRVAVV